MKPIGVVPGHEPTIGGDDGLARRRSLDVEQPQARGRIGLFTFEESGGAAGTIRPAWPAISRVIDVLEGIPLAQPRQGVGLEA